MKTLTLLRHCKSDWTTSDHDHDRPLNQRGFGDIEVIANELNKLEFSAGVCFYSTALRAKTTALGVTERLEYPISAYPKKELYTFDYEDVWDIIWKLSNLYDSVLLVGHNPAFTDMVNQLGDVRVDNVPTGGIAQFTFDLKDWKHIKPHGGILNFFEYPKILKNS